MLGGICLPSTTAPILCRRVADKSSLISETFRYYQNINGLNFAIEFVRQVFACIRGVAYERLRYKRGNLSEVAECDAEEFRQFWNWLLSISQSCGKVAVTLQNMLKGCSILGDRMLKCGRVEIRGI